MASRARPRNGNGEWWVAAVGFSALGLAAALWFHRPAPGTIRLSMSAGDELGMRHEVAGRLTSEARRHRIEIDLLPTAGSKEALDRVNSGRLQVTLVQGGLDPDGWPDVRQVTTLNVEPLHLLVREGIFAEVARDLAALRGRVVNLGKEGSGTHDLARAVLEFAGLDLQRGDYEARDLGYDDLERVEDGSRLPDAVFTVSTIRVSRFLVADFTGHRGGVYFSAPGIRPWTWTWGSR